MQALRGGLLSDLPAGPFHVVMKKPLSLKQPSEVLCLEDSLKFGEFTHKGTQWRLEIPYEEITSLDTSRVITGVVVGTLKDGRTLEFRLKSAGPRKELAKTKAMSAVSAKIGATGSIKPIGRSSTTQEQADSPASNATKPTPVARTLVMPKEPPPGYDPSTLPPRISELQQLGFGDEAREFIDTLASGGFFVDGRHGQLNAWRGDQAMFILSWRPNGTAVLKYEIPLPAATVKRFFPKSRSGVEYTTSKTRYTRDSAVLMQQLQGLRDFVAAHCEAAAS